MTREIKFRAWDWKKMIYDVQDVYDYGVNWPDINCESFWEVLRLYPVMQYVWLKDKNWKEIYEWDIVKNYSNGKPSFIFWNNFSCRFDLQDWHFTFNDLLKSEIIWNIYENPELIIIKTYE
jgi:hypothetical protein